jgi:AraC-like DNA-binding protein
MSTKNYITFSDLYTSEYTLTDIYAECQKWTDGSCFSRLDRPRKVSALIFLNGCSGTYTNSRGEVFHAAQKSFVCLPQSSKYSVLNLTSGAAFPDAFLIEFNIIKDGALLTFSDSPFLINGINPYYMEELCKTAVFEYEAVPRSPAAIKASIYSILSLLGKNEINEYGKQVALIAPALKFMEQNPYSSVSVEDLAAMCNISAGCFRRLFGDYTGKSPSRYKTDIKIEAAKKMLEGSATSVEQIATLLGFANSAYFCRTFKKETGLTPNEYRKNN